MLTDGEKQAIEKIVSSGEYKTTDPHHTTTNERNQKVYQFGLIHGPFDSLEFIFETPDETEFDQKVDEARDYIFALHHRPKPVFTEAQEDRIRQIITEELKRRLS